MKKFKFALWLPIVLILQVSALLAHGVALVWPGYDAELANEMFWPLRDAWREML